MSMNFQYVQFNSWKTVARTYDATILLSNGYDAALKNNIDLRNGSGIKQLMINKSIKST